MIKFIIGLILMYGVAGKLDIAPPDISMCEMIEAAFIILVGIVFMILGINTINATDEGK